MGWLSQRFADTSLFCKGAEAHCHPRAANLERKSLQMPLALLLDVKMERLKMKMMWEEWGTICGRHKKHEAPECYLFSLHYSASAVDPSSFASFCAGPPQRFPGFWDRWWVANSFWIGHLLTICFSSDGECMRLVCSRMATHCLTSAWGRGGSKIMASPQGQPQEDPQPGAQVGGGQC